MAKFAANLSMLLPSIHLLNVLRRQVTQDSTALNIFFSYDFSTDELASQLHQHNLTQVLFNLPAGNWQEGERGIACHLVGQKNFRRVFAER